MPEAMANKTIDATSRESRFMALLMLTRPVSVVVGDPLKASSRNRYHPWQSIYGLTLAWLASLDGAEVESHTVGGPAGRAPNSVCPVGIRPSSRCLSPMRPTSCAPLALSAA